MSGTFLLITHCQSNEGETSHTIMIQQHTKNTMELNNLLSNNKPQYKFLSTLNQQHKFLAQVQVVQYLKVVCIF